MPGSREAKPAAILVYGSDKLLLETRALVLTREGYRVISSLRLEEVEAIIQAEDIRVLVLCHTLSAQDCERAMELADAQRPFIKTMLLTVATPKLPRTPNGAILGVFDGPKRLVETARGLVLEAV